MKLSPAQRQALEFLKDRDPYNHGLCLQSDWITNVRWMTRRSLAIRGLVKAVEFRVTNEDQRKLDWENEIHLTRPLHVIAITQEGRKALEDK